MADFSQALYTSLHGIIQLIHEYPSDDQLASFVDYIINKIAHSECEDDQITFIYNTIIIHTLKKYAYSRDDRIGALQLHKECTNMIIQYDNLRDNVDDIFFKLIDEIAIVHEMITSYWCSFNQLSK